jgi:hypothetical protein
MKNWRCLVLLVVAIVAVILLLVVIAWPKDTDTEASDKSAYCHRLKDDIALVSRDAKTKGGPEEAAWWIGEGAQSFILNGIQYCSKTGIRADPSDRVLELMHRLENIPFASDGQEAAQVLDELADEVGK